MVLKLKKKNFFFKSLEYFLSQVEAECQFTKKMITVTYKNVESSTGSKPVSVVISSGSIMNRPLQMDSSLFQPSFTDSMCLFRS